MANRTIAQVKTKINNKMHGTTIDDVTDFYSACQDAAEMMLSRIDPQETIRRASLANAVYDNVYDYAIPEDLKAPADLNPQANADQINNSSLSRTFSRELINRKKDNQFAMVWRDTVQFLRFTRCLNTPVVFDQADAITSNGTWTVGGNASDLELDTFNYVSGNGSLRADLATPGALTNVIIRIGSDSSNYYTKTVTTGHFEAFKAGWNLLRFDYSSATTVGTPDPTDMKYVRRTVTYGAGLSGYYEKTLTNAVDLSNNNYTQDGATFIYQFFNSITSLSLIRIDNIVVSVATLYDITYYSNYLFRTNAGTWISKPTVDTDIVNLSEVSYKIFEAEICRALAQQVQGVMGAFDYNYWNNMLEGDGTDNSDTREGLYDRYLRQFPSERLEGETMYYDTSSYDDYDWGDSDGYGYRGHSSQP